MERHDILGVGFDNVTMEEAVARALAMASEDAGAARYIVTPNSEIVYLCRSDEAAREAVNNAAMVVPDGIGVIYAARILGKPLREKVAGIELGENILPGMAKRGLRLFLLGAKPGVAELAAGKLREKYPGLIISGTRDGYFKEEAEAVAAVNAAGADVVFVCLGAPKQELFMQKNRENIKARLMLGLGGSLDGYAGIADRGPDIFIKLGLEWLYRLLRQPSRIGRMMSLPKFLVAVIIRRMKGAGGNAEG